MARNSLAMGKASIKSVKKGTFSRIIKYVFKNYAVHMIIVFICLFLNTAASVRGTMFMETLFNDYIEPVLKAHSTDLSGLVAAIRTIAIFYLIGVLANYAQSKIMIYVTQGTLMRLRIEMFEHMEKLPISYFDGKEHGDVMSMYTNDIDTLRQLISQSLTQLVNAVLTVIATLGCMLYLSLPLTAITLGIIFLTFNVTKFLAKRSGSNFIAQQKNLGKVNGYIEEMISGQKVVKVFCHEEEAIEEFDKLNEELYESANNANKFANIIMPINAQLGNLSYVLCAVFGGIMAINHFWGLDTGKLITFLTFNKSFSHPVSQVSQQFNSIIMGLAGAERIFELLDTKPEVDDGYVEICNAKEVDGKLVECEERTGLWVWKHTHQADGSIEYKAMNGAVVFDDVDFGYVEGKTVLHNIKIDAKPGQKIAFVGATGAGKTTITNLINRFYDISDGKIRYDGININKIRKSDLRSTLGIVLQDTHLFTGTVRDNIKYGKLDATDEEVVAAAKLANAHGFIRRLPQGYDTVLTGQGASLSQGQRQLLAIARAAIADPPVLILDEATSSIDTRTEKLIQKGMDSLMKGRTTFVIAHRLSTVRNSDVIMVLDNGHIIEQGTHDELIGKKGKYYQLYTGKIVNA